MAFRKTQSVEKSELVTPEQHNVIANTLRKEGAASVTELDDEQRKKLVEDLNTDE